ncbi:transcriptional adapter 3 isoform X1 [Euwallacea similis]|uniref:transcriptional adapter 3 isoform X1 n=1 Tax=Euwallacea similis TaxID=1736056 RepID=UPI00344D4281
MISSKRSSFSSSKSSKHNGKLKEILSSSSSHSKSGEPKIADIKDFTHLPYIKQVDNATLLPKYTSVLLRSAEEGVAMDDLDQLQQELERLLSTNALRIKFFVGEYSHGDQKDSHDKKGHDKVSLKRKRPDDKSMKFKDSKSGLRLVKRDAFKSFSEKSYKEIPKITLPRNDNSDKFWASIEPYCAPVNKDDVAFLDTLIQEFSKEIEINIPELGQHYSSSWSDDILNDEQSLSKTGGKRPSDFKKNGLQSMVDSFGSPYTQRLLSLTERVLKTSNPNGGNGGKNNKIKPDFVKLKQFGSKVGACLDKRLLNELVKQGILTNDDINRNVPEDEILTEIKKCQQELVTVNEYNLEELMKLRTDVMNDIHCNQLKDDLDKVDKEMLDLYNNIIVARMQDEGKDYGKGIPDKTIKEFESKANALLRQQHVLNREINSMTDMSMLY